MTASRKSDLEERFREVYRRNLWGPLKSGPGSSVEATRSLREETAALVCDLCGESPTLTFVDAACGDMTWIPLLLHDLSSRFKGGIHYVGVDIVGDLIAANSASFGREGKIEYTFARLDLTREAPPRGDIVFCKDLVNHLSFADIRRVLAGFGRSGSPRLLISSNRGHENFDPPKMEGNGSRHVDLEAPPFLLPEPDWSNGYLALWPLPLPSGEKEEGDGGR